MSTLDHLIKWIVRILNRRPASVRERINQEQT